MAAPSSAKCSASSEDEHMLEKRASTCAGNASYEATQARTAFGQVGLDSMGGEFCDDDDFDVKHTAPQSKLSSRSRFSLGLRAAIFASGDPSIMAAACAMRTHNASLSQTQPSAPAAAAAIGVTQLGLDARTSDMAGTTSTRPASSPPLAALGHAGGANQTQPFVTATSATFGAAQLALDLRISDMVGTTSTRPVSSPALAALGHSGGANQKQLSAAAASTTTGCVDLAANSTEAAPTTHPIPAPPFPTADGAGGVGAFISTMGLGRCAGDVMISDASGYSLTAPPPRPGSHHFRPLLQTQRQVTPPQPGSGEAVPEASASTAESSAMGVVASSSPNTMVPRLPCAPQAKRRPAPFGYRRK